MLAIFQKTCAHPPEELNSPASKGSKSKLPYDMLRDFLASDPNNSFCTKFGDRAAISYIRSNGRSPSKSRMFCGLDDVYCLFLGSLNNLSTLIKQYGLCKTANEALLVIEAYRTLRDRGPYPADQVVKDFNGSFAFVVYDDKAGTVFVALSSDGGVKMFWGIAADGSVVLSDDLEVIKGSCGKSFAPFPTGCIFHSGGELQSFEHPLHKMKAMPRVDSEGVVCGATFHVDKYSRINSMPRVGSAGNWAPSFQ